MNCNLALQMTEYDSFHVGTLWPELPPVSQSTCEHVTHTAGAIGPYLRLRAVNSSLPLTNEVFIRIRRTETLSPWRSAFHLVLYMQYMMMPTGSSRARRYPMHPVGHGDFAAPRSHTQALILWRGVGA